jgi:hypothetical protein
MVRALDVLVDAVTTVSQAKVSRMFTHPVALYATALSNEAFGQSSITLLVYICSK